MHNMKLSNFEQQIDPVILQRGKNYWEAGLVTNVYYEGDTIVASVSGTSSYKVEIDLNDTKIEHAYCNCPYDWGRYCKHIAAVLLEIKNHGLPELKKESLTEILNSMGSDEMRKLLAEILSKEPHWRERIFARVSNDSDEIFRRYDVLLKEQIYSYSGKHGFIDYNQACDVGMLGDELLSDVETLIMDKEFEQALAISKAVLIEMNTAISNADDSNGFIGGAAGQAIQYLEMIAKASDLPSRIAEDLFSTLTDPDFLDDFTAFDWHFELMEIAVFLANTKDREKRLFEAALSFVRERDGDLLFSYSTNWYQELRLKYLQKFGSAMDAEHFIDENIHIPAFRKMKLEDLFRKGLYDKVIELAGEGLQLDQESPGLLRNWYEWILKAAEKKPDLELQREILLKLFSARYDLNYYKVLKSKYSESDWVTVRDNLLENFNGYWGKKADIFIEERMVEELWNLISGNMSLDVLAAYDQYLFPQYTNEVRKLYTELIPAALERLKGRKHYYRIAGIISSREKYLGPEFGILIVDELLQLFPNRPAMRDEFNKAGLL